MSSPTEIFYTPECHCCMKRGVYRMKDTNLPLYICPRTGQVHVLRVGASCGVWMQPLDAYNKEMCA